MCEGAECHVSYIERSGDQQLYGENAERGWVSQARLMRKYSYNLTIEWAYADE
jgi:hypothetical protein